MDIVLSTASPGAEDAAELIVFFDRFCALDIEIGGQILKVYSLGRVSEFLCNRLMSDTVAPSRRHHQQDETPDHRRVAGSAPGQLPEA